MFLSRGLSRSTEPQPGRLGLQATAILEMTDSRAPAARVDMTAALAAFLRCLVVLPDNQAAEDRVREVDSLEAAIQPGLVMVRELEAAAGALGQQVEEVVTVEQRGPPMANRTSCLLWEVQAAVVVVQAAASTAAAVAVAAEPS